MMRLIKTLNYRNSIGRTPMDYVRYATLRLCAETIYKRKIKGDVAELGVYQGKFAAELNRLFADRELHLFDTFKGFPNGNYGDLFCDTTVQAVMNRMPVVDRVHVHVGEFPKTIEWIPKSEMPLYYAFVNVDADLYEPTINGLNYFYPRLASGGYIFVHDYNNTNWAGVKQAVHEFAAEEKISFVPIPDSGGTIIITKP